ncbi:hypothetical protein Q3G72_026871 [Acer saccharum]|nr:hypothetical protein Q3G72_019474 [Acer saccharum]KAK1588773.1 hypothetical protein Q3G72_026871 [Acer saccharum]
MSNLNTPLYGVTVLSTGFGDRENVLFFGCKPGVYDTWDEVEPLVKGFPGAVHKSFSTREIAECAFVEYQLKDQAGVNIGPSSSSSSHSCRQCPNSARPVLDCGVDLGKELINIELRVAQEERDHAIRMKEIYAEAFYNFTNLSMKNKE